MVARFTEEHRRERLEFLENRQKGMGGSDMPVILGLVPGKNALDIYHEKTRPINPDLIGDDTIHQLRGHVLEDTALAHYWLHTGRKGRKTGIVARHPHYPAFGVRRDFEVFANSPNLPDFARGPGTGELKAPMSFVFGRILDEGLRESEIVQVQTNISVARHHWGSIAYFTMEHKDGPIAKVDMEHDLDLGEFLLDAGQRFWDEHVVPRIPPDPAEWSALMEREQAPPILDLSGEVELVDDDVFTELLERELERGDIKRDAEKAHDQAKADLLEAAKARESKKLSVPGVGRCTVVTQRRSGNLNADQLEEAMLLDRDKVARWLQAERFEAHGGPVALMDDAEIGRMLFECVADLELYRKPGSVSQFTRTSRSREVTDG